MRLDLANSTIWDKLSEVRRQEVGWASVLWLAMTDTKVGTHLGHMVLDQYLGPFYHAL